MKIVAYRATDNKMLKEYCFNKSKDYFLEHQALRKEKIKQMQELYKNIEQESKKYWFMFGCTIDGVKYMTSLELKRSIEALIREYTNEHNLPFRIIVEIDGNATIKFKLGFMKGAQWYPIQYVANKLIKRLLECVIQSYPKLVME